MLRGWAHEVKDENAAPPSLAEAARRSYTPASPGSGASDDGAGAAPRAKWNSRTEFLLATIGNCVGVGNVVAVGPSTGADGCDRARRGG